MPGSSRAQAASSRRTGAAMDPRAKKVRDVFTSESAALAAFDYMVAHAEAAGFRLTPYDSEVPSIELGWPDRQQNPYSIQARPGHVNFYLRGPILSVHQGLFEEATERFGEVRKNKRSEYRKRLFGHEDAAEMLGFLRKQGAWPSQRHDQRFVAQAFTPVTGEHLLRAARRIADGYTEHPFGESTTYDVLFDGARLPPKALFGLAATEALGFPVRPDNFRGGEGTPTFRILRDHGYPVVPKGRDPAPAAIPDVEDRIWIEGRQQLGQHLRRERGTGLAAAKRDRFRAEHGRLFCERCLMDPVERYGSASGEACIEVHHRRTQVAAMQEEHVTRLEDLMCLCASCHRVVHREMQEEPVAD